MSNKMTLGLDDSILPGNFLPFVKQDARALRISSLDFCHVQHGILGKGVEDDIVTVPGIDSHGLGIGEVKVGEPRFKTWVEAESGGEPDAENGHSHSKRRKPQLPHLT